MMRKKARQRVTNPPFGIPSMAVAIMVRRLVEGNLTLQAGSGGASNASSS